MMVGRLLSYWEGNFSGAMLNFGRVSPLTPFQKISDQEDKSWIFFWGGRRCAGGTSSGWMGAFFGGRRHSFLGRFFFGINPKNCPKESAWLLLEKPIKFLGGALKSKIWNAFFFGNDISIHGPSGWRIWAFTDNSRPMVCLGEVFVVNFRGCEENL